MILTVLGCSGSVPGPDGPCSGYLVEADGYRLVLDLGTGALGTLLRHCGPGDVDAVVLSHLHGDHWADLPALAYAQDRSGALRSERTEVIAPAGALAAALGGDDSRRGYVPARLRFRDAANGRIRLGPFTVTLARVRHQVTAFGIRVEAAGRTLVYSGDTGPCHAILGLAADADVLLCEAALAGAGPGVPVPPSGTHLDAAQAAEIAASAGAGALVLTHLRPWADRAAALAEARAEYGGPIVLASPGLRMAV